jgi:hypothetical protein
MRLSADLSIRQKLTRIVFITCGGALLLACSIFAVYDAISFRSSLKSELATLAEMAASNRTARCCRLTARETLASLRAPKNMERASIYTRDGSVFASYLSGYRNGELRVTESFGVAASAETQQIDPRSLLHLADEAIARSVRRLRKLPASRRVHASPRETRATSQQKLVGRRYS